MTIQLFSRLLLAVSLLAVLPVLAEVICAATSRPAP